MTFQDILCCQGSRRTFTKKNCNFVLMFCPMSAKSRIYFSSKYKYVIVSISVLKCHIFQNVKVLLCLNLLCLTVTIHSVFPRQPGLSVSACFHCKIVVTEPVLGQDLSLLHISDREEIVCQFVISV